MASLVTLALAKSQERITQNAEDTLVQQYLDAADVQIREYLDRCVYATQGDLDTAKQAVSLTDAFAAYEAAATAWESSSQSELDAVTWEAAKSDWRAARTDAQRVLRGIVLNPAITQAILLLVAHWCVNREAVVTDRPVELPWGVTNLLAGFRVGGV